MKISTSCLIALFMALVIPATAQTSSDTLKQSIRRYTARNFSEIRTFNLYWETSPSQDYKMRPRGDNPTEEGRMSDIYTFKFSATLPILLLKNFSLYANGEINSYRFNATNNENGEKSSIFLRNYKAYNYYDGTITANYRTRIGNKPLILIASAMGDGWDEGFEKAQGLFSAIAILKQTRTSSFSTGLYVMTLFDKIPVFPIIAYSSQLGANWGIDITLPSRAYMRYQLKNKHRFSLGASLSNEHFYLKTGMKNLPDVSYFNRTSIKPELVYEYIIDKHFYLIARAGGSALIRGGIYGTNRKGVDGEPYLKLKQPMSTFFNVGFSYNLFK